MLYGNMICNHHSKQKVYEFKTAILYQCPQCQLIISSLVYDENFDPIALYENFYKDGNQGGRFNFGLEYIIRSFRWIRARRIHKIYPKADSILDIGSGRGYMLYYLKKYFHFKQAAGTQIAKNAVRLSRKKLSLTIYEDDVINLNLNHNSFDIICLWHVLEHVSKPEEYIKKIYDLLKPKGKLIIEVPNFSSWTRKWTNKYWVGLDLKYHVYFFTPSSLSKLLHKYNFQIKKFSTFSWEYSTFFSVQSIVSRLTNSDQVLFQYLQSGNFKFDIVWHLLLFIVLTPICFIINFLLNHTKKGEIIFIVAEKPN